MVNVAKVAEVPEGTVRRSRSMTTAQARQLLNSDLDTWWRAYFTLALYCGLRPGELTGLRWTDVDLDEGLIRVRRSLKRGIGGAGTRRAQDRDRSKRTLTMPDPVRSALAGLRREQKEPTGCASARTTWTSTTWCSATTQAVRCPASG